MITRDMVMRNRYLAGRVKRYHTWPTLHVETVAEHSYNVLRIYREIFGPPEARITEFILDHDLPELHTGDLPFPVKVKNPVLTEQIELVEQSARTAMELPSISHYDLSEQERRQVKICDLLQMWEFGVVESRMGSMFADCIVGDMAAAATKLADECGCLDPVLDWMRDTSL